LAALTTRAKSSVLLDPRAHTFLISPIQSEIESVATQASFCAPARTGSRSAAFEWQTEIKHRYHLPL